MDHVKETKTDKQAPAATATSSTSASCSSSSTSASSPSDAQHDQDGSHDVSLPAAPSPSSTTHAADSDATAAQTRAEGHAADAPKPMDVDQQSAAEDGQTAAAAATGAAAGGADGGSAASSEPATMTDDLASSLSSTTLTTPFSAPDTAAPPADPSSSSSSSSSAAASSPSQSPSPSPPPSSSSSSASSSASPATSELSTATLDADEQRIQECLKLMHADIKKGEASVRAILKMMQNLHKAPTKPDNRRMRKDNIVVKKNVVEVTGALALLELVGYHSVELKGHPYLALDDAAGFNSAMVDKAIKLLLQYQERQVADEKKPASVTSGTRVRCAGGCGYWGDSSLENLCSICFKTKHLGASTTAALTGISPSEPKKCVKQCGLFGSDKFGGQCSQCFSKEKDKAAARRTGKQRWLGARRQLHAVYLFSLGKQEEQANKGRCFVCSKRLPVPIECRCRRTFCSSHRFPLDHQCSYDAASEQKRKLRRQLIHMQTSKMDKI